MSWIDNLRERRVFQIVGIYVIGAWGFVQFVDWAVERYILSPYLVEFVVLTLILLLPAVVALAYFHGAPGRDRWGRVEKIGIPVNLAVAGLVLYLVFAGRSLGAAGDTVTVETPDGERVERMVPRAEFRSDLALFYFDNETGDPSLDWMQYATTLGLEFDLSQDPFITVISAFGTNGISGSMDADLREAGFAEGVGVPLALKRELTTDRHLQYMVSGSLKRDGSQFALTTFLHEAGSGRLKQERTFTGPELLPLLDEASLQLRMDLGVPAATLESAPDLPLTEILTESTPALEESTIGIRALMTGDLRTARQHFEKAVELDPTFAIAQSQLAFTSLALNDRPRAAAAMDAAMRHEYRFPERVRMSVQATKAMMFDEDQDRALEIARYWTDVYPRDIAGHAFLAQILVGRNQLREAISEFEKVVEIDASQYNVLQTLATLHLRLGEDEKAIERLALYAEAFPADYRSYLNLGKAEAESGDFERAAASFQRALAASPGETEVRIEIARLAAREGRPDEAEAALEATLDESRSATDSTTVLRAMEGLYSRRGRIDEALAAYRERRDIAVRTLGPVNAVMAGGLFQAPALELAALTGRGDFVRGEIARFREELPAPMNGLMTVTEMELAVETKDVEAPSIVDEAEAAIRALGAEILISQILDARGELAENRGDCEAADVAYNRIREQNPGSSAAALGLARCRLARGAPADVPATLQPLLRRDPWHPEAQVLLAKAAIERGDRGAAREALERALVIWKDADPAYARAREAHELLAGLGT